MQLQNFTAAAFLRDDWQRQPRLFRQAWPDFEDPIEAELLAGLAMEEGVDARVVTLDRATQSWSVEHGPFEDYEAYGEEDWTLLVQSVNEWWPQVQQLLTQFRFLPDWRVDDVMVSFAVPGGSVGPHLDQYDVFIIQGSGQRRWQVGSRSALPQHRPHPDLQQLAQPFTPVIDEVLEAGDMLYIPAGCPHHGEALTPSLNFSIGFRAPAQTEFQAAVADMLLDADQAGSRYQDPVAESYGDSWRVSNQQLTAIKDFLQQQPDPAQLDNALLRVLSMSKRPLPQPELDLEPEQVQVMATDDVWFCRTPGARLLVNDQGDAYVNGEYLEGVAAATELVAKLAATHDDVPAADLDLASANHAKLVAQLVNLGAWFFSVDADDVEES